MVRRCPSERINSSGSLVKVRLGWKAVFLLATVSASSCVDGFSFLAMFWSLSFGWRPGGKAPCWSVNAMPPKSFNVAGELLAAGPSSDGQELPGQCATLQDVVIAPRGAGA